MEFNTAFQLLLVQFWFTLPSAVTPRALRARGIAATPLGNIKSAHNIGTPPVST